MEAIHLLRQQPQAQKFTSVNSCACGSYGPPSSSFCPDFLDHQLAILVVKADRYIVACSQFTEPDQLVVQANITAGSHIEDPVTAIFEGHVQAVLEDRDTADLAADFVGMNDGSHSEQKDERKNKKTH